MNFMKFHRKRFEDIDLNDPIFNSLKEDYSGSAIGIGFEEWFYKKAKEGRYALVLEDNEGLGAFVSIKTENEPLRLKTGDLPSQSRLKICTFCLAERYRGQRMGEGAIGTILWKWQRSRLQEVYVTVFQKQKLLISLFTRFGFQLVGYNENDEQVYMRSRENIDYSNPYKSFPFINPHFTCAGYVLIDDGYHDTLFPHSELKNTTRDCLIKNVSNGLTKCYIGSQWMPPPYQIGDPVFIYRKYNGSGPKLYKSCLTTYCVVTDIIWVKKNWKYLMSLEGFLSKIANKTVFDREEIENRYNRDRNIIIINMLYYGFFGAGKNITCKWLIDNKLWPPKGDLYPAMKELSRNEFAQILQKGQINVDDIIID